MMTIKLRYKEPHGETSKLIVHTITSDFEILQTASDNFRFSAAIAELGLLLRESSFRQGANYEQVIQLAKQAKGTDDEGYRSEFVRLVELASVLERKTSTSKN